ncbi:MAG: hypothetical protein VYE22_32445, partial [Myxococcota bacterium]|nr:hypothetical protein [Myxococcota bacterium]
MEKIVPAARFHDAIAAMGMGKIVPAARFHDDRPRRRQATSAARSPHAPPHPFDPAAAGGQRARSAS